MTILFLTYQGDVSGATFSIAYLAKGLAERGNTVLVGCRKESLLYQLLSGTKVQVIAMSFRSKFDAQCIRQIVHLVRTYDIDIINAQSSKDRYLSMFARYACRSKVSVIHTRRQICESIGGLQALFYQRFTQGIIAVSEQVKDSMVEKGFDRKKITVIPNGSPPEKYRGISKKGVKALKAKFEISKSDFVIGVVARRKSQVDLIKAISLLPFQVKVIFVGITREQIKEELYYLRGDHQVYFEGILPPGQVLPYYKIFNVNVLPSSMEGLSQTLLEAMFLKVPVIATEAGGNLSLVEHEVTGLLYSPGDHVELARQILHLKHDATLRKKLKKNAFVNVSEKYTMAGTVDKYEDFFKNILTQAYFKNWANATTIY
jgi:glycosyltransferase involved in cell wall biosynthesis